MRDEELVATMKEAAADMLVTGLSDWRYMNRGARRLKQLIRERDRQDQAVADHRVAAESVARLVADDERITWLREHAEGATFTADRDGFLACADRIAELTAEAERLAQAGYEVTVPAERAESTLAQVRAILNQLGEDRTDFALDAIAAIRPIADEADTPAGEWWIRCADGTNVNHLDGEFAHMNGGNCAEPGWADVADYCDPGDYVAERMVVVERRKRTIGDDQ